MSNRWFLIEDTLRGNLAKLSKDGALVVQTGAYTGRATQDRFIVEREEIVSDIDWGKTNKKLPLKTFKILVSNIRDKFEKQKHYTYKGYVGGLPVKLNTYSPWHALFARNMFRSKRINELPQTKTIQIFHDPHGSTKDYGLNIDSDVIIALDVFSLTICIVGTAYAGEIKKACFSMCNYLLPKYDIFPMHASANCLKDGTNSCVLFGLSGTGKTTLSTSKDKYLIGDDEIIWSKDGLSNLEGGCYAKLINLSEDKEPEIFKAANLFGSILENVVMDENSRTVDFDNSSRTENTRGSYKLDALSYVFDQSKIADFPKSIIFLTADAFGALPLVAKLTNDQLIYYFISGYTAKVAGTEIGVKKPECVFSACFGAPFMPRHPMVYAKLLSEYVKKSNANVWLVNTGWTGGDYETGSRFPIDISRTVVNSIQKNEIGGDFTQHPIFGFHVPKSLANVDQKFMMVPQGEKVKKLATGFIENMNNLFGNNPPKGGPVVS